MTDQGERLTALQAAAYAAGADHSGVFDPKKLIFREEVRAMCAAGRCRQYGRSWMCPPALEELSVWQRRVSSYAQGLLLQVTCTLEDDFDYESMQAGEHKLQALIKGLMAEQGKRYPGLLFLQAGSCTLCKSCTYPDAACRCPELAVPSLEAIGLLVTELCELAALPYYYGPGTLTYNGAVLLP